MSQHIEFRSAWDDPNVRAALKSRTPDDISLICCVKCGNYGYYNDGSHFSCSVDGCNCSLRGSRLDAAMDAGEVITLAELNDFDPETDGIP